MPWHATSPENEGLRGPAPTVTKRVAVITHGFPKVSETFVVDHILGLARRGWEPTVVCEEVDGPRLAALERDVGRLKVVIEPAPRLPLPSYLGHAVDLLRAIWLSPRAALSAHGRVTMRRTESLSRVLEELRPDLVHAHFGTNGIPAALAARRRVPVVVDFHGWDFTVFPRRIGWGLFRKALRRCVIVAHSSFAQERLEAGIARPIRRVPLGVDLSEFSAPERGRTWPRQLRLLTVGRLIRQKGVHVAVEALAMLVRSPARVDATLTIVGDGPERSDLKELASSLAVDERIRFLPSVPHKEVASIMASSDVLLVPSIVHSDGAQEAFGRVAIEGLAAGLAVVVSATGGLQETVGRAGWTVPPADAEALAACVERILTERTPEDVRSSARSRAEEFSIDAMWNSYAEVAEDAVRTWSRGLTRPLARR